MADGFITGFSGTEAVAVELGKVNPRDRPDARFRDDGVPGGGAFDPSSVGGNNDEVAARATEARAVLGGRNGDQTAALTLMRCLASRPASRRWLLLLGDSNSKQPLITLPTSLLCACRRSCFIT